MIEGLTFDVKGIDSPQALLDELTYASYAHNRINSPQVTPSQWAKIYPNVDALEARYQRALGVEA